MTLLPFLCLALSPLQDAPLLHSTFADGEDGWAVTQIVGDAAKVVAVHDADRVKIGKGSLKLTYPVAEGQIAAASKATPNGLAKLGSERFWVFAEQNTPLVVTLQEKDGAQFNASFTTTKGKWQEVEIGVQDFVPGDNAGSSSEANTRLDPDQVNAVSIIDLDTLLVQNAAITNLLGMDKGSRTIYLSDFQLTTKPSPDSSATKGKDYVFDDYNRPQASWLALSATASNANDMPGGGRALKLESSLAAGKLALALKAVRPGVLYAKKSMAFSLASTGERSLLIQVEEKSGGKYEASVRVPSGSTAVERTVTFDLMKPSGDSKDGNGKLDVDEIKQLAIIDLTAATGSAAGSSTPNTLWIGKVTASG